MLTSRSLKVLILSEKIIDSQYSLCISEKDKKLGCQWQVSQTWKTHFKIALRTCPDPESSGIAMLTI